MDAEECADEASEAELGVGLAERGTGEAEAEEARSTAVNSSFWWSSSSLASFVEEGLE